MTIPELESHAIQLFTEGKLSCSESVLQAMADFWGVSDPLIPRIATPFRGGLCGTQQVCGVVSGGLMAIGIRLGRDSGSEDGKACVAKGKEFIAWVNGEFGALGCRELTGLDFADEEQHKLFQQQRRGEVCVPLVAKCCRWLAEKVVEA